MTAKDKNVKANSAAEVWPCSCYTSTSSFPLVFYSLISSKLGCRSVFGEKISHSCRPRTSSLMGWDVGCELVIFLAWLVINLFKILSVGTSRWCHIVMGHHITVINTRNVMLVEHIKEKPSTIVTRESMKFVVFEYFPFNKFQYQNNHFLTNTVYVSVIIKHWVYALPHIVVEAILVPIFWRPFNWTPGHCDTLSLWHPIIVTPCHCDTRSLWHPVVVTPGHCGARLV